MIKKKLTIEDWMSNRPYKKRTHYDRQYLLLSQKLFSMLRKEEYLQRAGYEVDDYKEIAMIIACYFEDFISEIGMWGVFTCFNEELHGWPVPFATEDYDDEYINPEDISYLIWHHRARLAEKILPLDDPMLEVIGWKVFEFLETMIEKTPVTNIFKEYFTLGEDADFFEIKDRLAWLAMSSYMVGIELNGDWKEELRELAKEVDGELPMEYLSTITYSMLNPYLFKRKTGYAALGASDFLIALSGCSEQTAADIRGLSGYIKMSHYSFVEETEDAIVVQHPYTDRLFNVLKKSLSPEGKRQVKEVTSEGAAVVMTSLAPWKGEWWVSGLFAVVPGDDALDSYKDLGSISFHAYSDEVQKLSRENAAHQEETFRILHGDSYYLAQTPQEVGRIHKELQDEDTRRLGKTPPKQDLDFGKVFSHQKDGMLLHFEKGVGIRVHDEINPIIALMGKESLTWEETKLLYSNLYYNYPPDVARYLLANFPTRNVKYPIEASKTDALAMTEFMFRFNSPEDYEAVTPSNIVDPYAAERIQRFRKIF